MYVEPCKSGQVALSTRSRSNRILQGGDIAPAEKLRCAAVEDLAQERVMCGPRHSDVIRVGVIMSKRECTLHR